MSNYSSQLRDPRWQRKRLEIMERDKFSCRYCGNEEKTLNVHHVIYQRGKAPWEYDAGLLLTLCEDCHTKFDDQFSNALAGVVKTSLSVNAAECLPHHLSELESCINNGVMMILDELTSPEMVPVLAALVAMRMKVRMAMRKAGGESNG